MENQAVSNDSTLIFFVNGRKIVDDNVEPEWTLLRYLREKLRLPGAKLGCGEGGCGACTVMVSKLNRNTGKIKHFSVNACLMPIGATHGLSVITTEGIGSTRTRIHPVQERLAKAHGSQCGFCTPGFVMSMYTLLRNNPTPSMEEIEQSLVGNLCRCTGYRPILDGFRTFSKDAANGCGRKDCCQVNKTEISETINSHENGYTNGFEIEATTVLFDPKECLPYDPTQDIIFPPELKMNPQLDFKNLVLKGKFSTFYRPVTLDEVLRLKKLFPTAKIVVGNTEVGVEMKNQQYPVIIHPANIPELLRITQSDSYLEIGAAAPLADLEVLLRNVIEELPQYKTKVLCSILEMLKWFGNQQIRNVAGLGGNIMNGSPISDLNPILMAAGARLVFRNLEREREIVFDDSFFTGYRNNICKPDEVLVSIKIPFTSENEYFKAFKQARRKDDDIAIVNAAMKVSFDPGSCDVSSVTLVFGGMGPTTIMARKTMQKLSGCQWNQRLIEKSSSMLLEELTLDPSAPGGMVDYRRVLAISFFFKFYLHVRHELHSKNSDLSPPLTSDEQDLISPYKENHSTKSAQFFQNVPEGQDKIDPVGRPVVHTSALKQATGEAAYIDDLPPFENELHGALVVSERPHAKILNIDDSEALQMEGVKGFFCAKDLPGKRNIGIGLIEGEEIFASKQVECVGQVIGVVVAVEQSLARRAAEKVKVYYENLPNPIFTIEDAIKANSMWGDPMIIESGNVEEGFRGSEHILEGEMRVGGQEHFYLEPNAHIAIPREDGEIELSVPNQSLTELQKSVSCALAIPANRVVAKVRRVGGGFGGKETRNIHFAISVSVAANALRQPVRLVVSREEDMLITGGRHPFLGRWKIGFNKDGVVNAIDTQLYSNGGWSLDMTELVMRVAIFNFNSAYKVDNLKISGHCCKTNLPSNTAFRAFGSPQIAVIIESAITAMAEFLQLDAKQVRERNIYGNSVYTTHFGQEIFDCKVEECWNEVLEKGEYEKRRKMVEDYNRRNTYKKRGLSVVPLKYGVGLEPKFMNQAGALILVYTDGSILLTHGGMEMGQGLHTKMIQIASRVLEVPMENIYIAETSTDKVPNTLATSASISSELNGMAVMDACNKINERLRPFKEKLPKGTWKDWVSAAYYARVSLSATGFFKGFNSVEYSFEEKKPSRPFNYLVYGAGLSEVEVDCLSGDHRVLRADIVMDIGNSLNPAIDIGQIEGGFLQGYGLYTMEQLLYSSSGDLLTNGPGTYKIPTVMDIPREFNVTILRGSSNPRAIYSSKAVGEPPLVSAVSVFYALRDAVRAACEAKGEKVVRFDSPATAERIRMACKDWITDKIQPNKGPYRPWAFDASS